MYGSNARGSVREDRMVVDGYGLSIKEGEKIVESVGGSRYCYSRRLEIGGNCRICGVKISGEEKGVMGCMRSSKAGMSVIVNGGSSRKAREGVMEMLLRRHPLDCVICDQGGECDLQDESIRVGRMNGRSGGGMVRNMESVGRKVVSKYRRCISCNRCVRYGGVVGNGIRGSVGRGSEVRIDCSMGRDSGLEGNVIDVCPVSRCCY